MDEQQPGRGPNNMGGADILKFLAALLAAVGLGSLVNYFRRRSERKQAGREQRRQVDQEAGIAAQRARGHQPVEVRVGPLAGILVVTAVFGLMSSVALWGLLYLLNSRAEQADVPVAPIATAALPSGPQLQANPPADWQRMRATDEAILHSTGQNADSTTHIPIEQAMDELARRGLPTLPGAQDGVSEEQAHDLESSGGQPPGGIPTPSPQATSAVQPTATATLARSTP